MQIVSHFDNIEIKEGKFVGYAEGETFRIKELRRHGNGGHTTITYYDENGEEIVMIQHHSRDVEPERKPF